MRSYLIRFLLFLLDRRGGLSFGGPGTNSIRDIINNINSGGGVPANPLHSVQYHNPQGSFDGDDGFVFYEDNRLGLASTNKLVFDEDESADTYWKYNTTNDYLELYTDGNLRAQF